LRWNSSLFSHGHLMPVPDSGCSWWTAASNNAVSDQFTILKLVTARLETAGIAYMLTGSIASGHYAQPRMTRDIDLVVEVQLRDAERLAALFRDEFECDVDAIRTAIGRQSVFNLIHTEAIVKVDFLVRKNTPYRQEEFARRRAAVIDGHPVWIVSPEDLILSKLFWAKDTRSELQLRDVRQLIAAQPTVDWPYLNRWAPQLGVTDLLSQSRQ